MSETPRTPRPRRPVFRASDEFVVIRPFRLSADKMLWPGDPIDKAKFRRAHLRGLSRRRRIASAGSDYARQMLEVWQGKMSPPSDMPTEAPPLTPEEAEIELEELEELAEQDEQDLEDLDELTADDLLQ